MTNDYEPADAASNYGNDQVWKAKTIWHYAWGPLLAGAALIVAGDGRYLVALVVLLVWGYFLAFGKFRKVARLRRLYPGDVDPKWLHRLQRDRRWWLHTPVGRMETVPNRSKHGKPVEVLHVPTIRGIEPHPQGIACTVELLPGQTVDDLEKARTAIASALDVHDVMIERQPSARMARMIAVLRDPLAGTRGALPSQDWGTAWPS